MAVQMVHRDQGQTASVRVALRVADTNEQRTNQTRSRGHSHARQLVFADARFVECRGNRWSEQLEMSSRCNLGHHTTERGMVGDL